MISSSSTVLILLISSFVFELLLFPTQRPLSLIRINPVLIEQINCFDPEPSERCLGDLLDVFGRLSRLYRVPAGWNPNPNFVAITTRSRKGARASPTSSSFVKGP
jgi:hypothetical protein